MQVVSLAAEIEGMILSSTIYLSVSKKLVFTECVVQRSLETLKVRFSDIATYVSTAMSNSIFFLFATIEANEYCHIFVT